MICMECENKSNIKDMYNHENIECCNCKRNYKYIEEIRLTAQKFYTERVIKLSNLDSFINIDRAEKLEISYEKLIYEITSKLSIIGKKYCDYNDKKKILFNIIGSAYEAILEKIKGNTASYMYFFIICFEYNRFIAGARVSNLNMYKNGNDKIITQDNIVNMICNLDRKGYNTQLEIDLAKERWVLEIIINICYSTIQSNKEVEFNIDNICNIEYMSNIFKYISIVFEAKALLDSKELKNNELVIDKIGNFSLNIENDTIQRYSDFINSDRSSLITNMESSPEIINDENLNNHIKNYFGLNLKEMETFRNKIKDVCNLDELIIGGDDLWIKFIQKFSNVNYKDAKKFFEHSIKDKSKDINNLLKMETKNSMWHRSILRVNNMYFSVYSIFLFMIINLMQDLIIGEVDDYTELKPKLEEYYGGENEKFELEVVEFLKLNYSNAIIIHDIREGYFNLADSSGFPGQIDILLLYKGEIYIVECKNYNLKITLKSEENLMQRIKTKAYRNMQKKIAFINENREYILKKYGQEIQEYSSEVKGIIAIANFTSIKKVENMPIVNYKEIGQCLI